MKKKRLDKKNSNFKINTNIKSVEKVKIENNLSQETLEVKFMVYMILKKIILNFHYGKIQSKEIKNTISRISKLNLSKTAEEIFQETLLTYSYTPSGMSIEEFLEIKINWLIE